MAFIYFAAARAGLFVATLNNISPVWPATGIAMFFVLLWGPQVAAGVFAGAFFVNYLGGLPAITSLGVATGNTLEALVGIWLFGRLSTLTDKFGVHAKLITYVLISTFPTAISASLGTISLYLTHLLEWESWRSAWVTWWVGDTLGALILFPFGVKIFRRELRLFDLNFKKSLQLGVLLGSLAMACYFVFHTRVGAPFLFVFFAPLLLAAIWLNASWTYVVCFLTCAYSIIYTAHGQGPFSGGQLTESLVHLQLFLAGVGLTAVLLGSLKQEGLLKSARLTLMIGWVMTGTLFYSFYQAGTKSEYNHFQLKTEQAEQGIQDSLRNQVRLLESGVGLFAASAKVSQSDWSVFTEKLKSYSRFPGSRGMAVALYAGNEAEFRKLNKTYPVHGISYLEKDETVLNPPDHLIVSHLEYYPLNKNVLGLDIMTEKTRSEAARRARDSGLASLTSKFFMMNDKLRQPAFSVYVPMYKKNNMPTTLEERRENFLGVVYSPIDAADFVRASVAPFQEELNLSVYFGAEKKENQMYSSLDDSVVNPLTKKSHINLAGLPVVFVWQQAKGFQTASNLISSWAGFCGALISILLAVMISSLESITDRAQKIAEVKTRELQKSQEAMVAASRMSSLGEMAGGIAHEINNPLAIIAGKAQNLELLVAQPNFDAARVHKYTEGIISNVERIAKIIRGLRTIARDVPNDPLREVRTQDILQDTLELCKSRFKHHNVALIVNVSAQQSLLCWARPEQIVQVMLNLLNNAFDAVQSLEEKWVQIDVVNQRGKVFFMVTDSGRGMAPELRDKIFLPFFTTKEVGKGTGLGLSVSRGIMEKHDGKLYVDETSANTKFIVELNECVLQPSQHLAV